MSPARISIAPSPPARSAASMSSIREADTAQHHPSRGHHISDQPVSRGRFRIPLTAQQAALPHHPYQPALGRLRRYCHPARYPLLLGYPRWRILGSTRFHPSRWRRRSHQGSLLVVRIQTARLQGTLNLERGCRSYAGSCRLDHITHQRQYRLLLAPIHRCGRC